MTEKCSKCGNKISPDWIVCPICKKKVRIKEEDKVFNDYVQYKIERIERFKQMSNPFNEKYFAPSLLMGIIGYIFTIPFTGPLFGFVIPLIVILGAIIGGFTTVYIFSSLKLRMIKNK